METCLRFGLGLWRYPGQAGPGSGCEGAPAGCALSVRLLAGEGGRRRPRAARHANRRLAHLDRGLRLSGLRLSPCAECRTAAASSAAPWTDGFVRVNEFQETSVPDVFCAGEPTGIGGADCALVEGQIAGLGRRRAPETARALFGRAPPGTASGPRSNEAFALRPELRQLATAGHACLPLRGCAPGSSASVADWRAAKLHTRCGMGSCQGRTCGAAPAFLFGWENDSVRPPLFPVRLASLSSDRHDLDNDTRQQQQDTNYEP